MLSRVLCAALFACMVVFIHGQESDSICRQKTLKRDMFISLHDAITRYAIEYPETQHVDLLTLGLPLDYDDFNPGKTSRFAAPGTLPVRIIENAIPLVNKIFPTGATVKPEPANTSENVKDYHFESLSSTFDYILTHMMLLPRNFSAEEKLRAKFYLQELVPNPELVIQNKTVLPRYMLYDYYRSLYLREKEEKETQIARHKESLTQEDYEKWGIKILSTLESNTDAAFQKWIIFGYKTEVEQELQYFDIDTHEDKLMSARALFKSMAVFSERDPHVQIYPFRFEPENWYQMLNSKEAQSSDQLRYQMSLLQAQQTLMNAAKNDLANQTNEDVNASLDKIKVIMETLHERVKNAVDRLIQMEVECFAKVNLTVCGNIIDTHTAFKLLLNDVAEHYEQAAYLESILNGRTEALSVLLRKLGEIASSIKSLDKQISAAEDAETSETIDITTGKEVDPLVSISCKEAGKIQFSFHTSLFDADESLCEVEGEDSRNCSDVRIPLNATQSPLWSVHSCALDDDLVALDSDVLSTFHSEMNSLEAEIGALLLRVDIIRPWLDPDIFMDSNIYTMKRNRGLVSPGQLEPLNYFHQVAESGRYLMPQYTSSLVLASNVSLFFPGLGSWRDEQDNDYNNHTNGIINMLMKYAYAPTLEGGYGPFALAPKGGIRKDVHNFRVERRNGGLMIRVPGAQVVGFVSSALPKFPEIQENLPQPVTCTLQPSSSTHQRRKRSALSESKLNKRTNLRELSNRLFSVGTDEWLVRRDDQITTGQRREQFTPSKSLDKLLQSADKTNEKISKFLEKIDVQERGEDIVSIPVAVPPDRSSKGTNSSTTS